MKRALIIDCNYICHAARHALPKLSTPTKNTGVIYGFIKRVINLAHMFPSDNIVFVWDSKSSIRREIYPKYKEGRKDAIKSETPEEKEARIAAFKQFDELRDSILDDLGFVNNYMQDGYEGDDLMASVVQNNPGYKFVIVSTDGDLYQLISNNCKMYNPRSKMLHDTKWFCEEYGCDPSLWGEAKAIAGCRTDGVRGVSGVGEKTAIKYLLRKMNPQTEKFKKIESSTDERILNRELVVLPMHGTEKIKIKPQPKLEVKKFTDFCHKNNFKSLMSGAIVEKWRSMIQ